MIDVDTEIAAKVVEERMKFTSALQAHCPEEAKDIEQGGDISSSISKCMKINAQTVVIQEHSDIMSQNKPNASQSGERFKIAFIISGTTCQNIENCFFTRQFNVILRYVVISCNDFCDSLSVSF